MAKRKPKQLEESREKAVLAEIVDMYIENDGVMPSARQIKKNRYISEEEVNILRYSDKLHEWQIRKMANEKTGKEYKTSMERHKEASAEAAKRRKEEAERKRQEEIRRVAENLVRSEEAAKQEETVMEEKKVEEVKTTETKVAETKPVNQRKGVRYAEGEVEEMLRVACIEAEHILTQTEVNALAAEGKLPRWKALNKHAGPWYFWDEKFGLPFANEKQTNVAMSLKAKEAEDEAEATEEVEPEVTEETSISREPKELKEPKSAPEDAFLETEKPEEDVSGEVIELPFKLIVPKGIHGTFSFYFSI